MSSDAVNRDLSGRSRATAEGPSGVKVLCQRHTSYYAGQARDPHSGTDSAPTESPGTYSSR